MNQSVYTPHRSKTAGFTLVEILIVLVIFGILASISVPSFLNYRQQIKLDQSIQLLEMEMQSFFSSARSEPRKFIIQRDDNKCSEKDNGIFCFITYDCPATITNLSNDCEENEVPLSPGIQFKEPAEFTIQFTPPHGDIKFLNSSNPPQEIPSMPEEKEITMKVIADPTKTETLKIYRKSGLIHITSS